MHRPELDILQAQECYASKERQTIIDVINPYTDKTACFGKDFDEIRAEYPDAERMTVDAFCHWKASKQRSKIQWNETTREKYIEMLEVLPPAAHINGAFLLGEPFDSDALTGRPRFDAYKPERTGTREKE